MAADSSTDHVAAERLARLRSLRDAVLLASEGAFDEAVQRIDGAAEDEIGELALAVRNLICDFRVAIEQSALTIEEFGVSRRELLEKLDTIEKQRAAIQKLSAPIIDVWDSVVTVPLTGVLDHSGAEELTERLLAWIHRSRIAWVILDLTGATQVDAQLTEHLVRLASAARLMGARCLVTGMGPKVAQSMVALGVSPAGLWTFATLKEGLRYCLSRLDGG